MAGPLLNKQQDGIPLIDQEIGLDYISDLWNIFSVWKINLESLIYKYKGIMIKGVSQFGVSSVCADGIAPLSVRAFVGTLWWS